MKAVSIFLATISIVALFCISAIAEENQPTGRFIDRNQEGFFWYKDPSDEVTEQVTQMPEQSPPEKPIESVPEGPAPYSTVWLRENLPKYLDAAIDNPTPENVSAYLYLQQYSLEKASQYSDIVESVTFGNPILDGNNQRPIATFANNAVLDRTNERRNELMHELSNKIAIFYFVDQGALSEAQHPIIDIFKNTYNFSGVTISYKSKIPFDTDQRPDIGHSDLMGVTSVPAIVVASADGRFDVISQAPVSLPELTKRIFVSAGRLNVIDTDTLDSLKPIANKPSIPIAAIKKPEGFVPISQADVVRAFNGGN